MRPTLRCVLLAVGGLPVALLPALISARLWPLWIAWVGLLVLATGLDAMLGLSRRKLRCATLAPPLLYIGEQGEMVVSVAGPPARAGLRLMLLVEVEGDLAPPDPLSVVLGEGGAARVAVPLTPRRRGTSRIAEVWLRWEGPLGLVQRVLVQPATHEVLVVPNVRAVRRAALRFFSSRHFLAGLRAERYVGDGSEFEALREFVPGLDHRAIDWKATARHRKLLVQEFRAERNQQIVLAIDTGHLMREPIAGVPKLDHAINAGLLLGYFSLRAGDRVGLFAFDEGVRAYVEPTGGAGAFRRLQAASAALEYRASETNFTLGLAELATRLRRRSLVAVLTDFVDVVAGDLMIENLVRLSRRHLVLFVTLRDPGLGAVARAAPASADALHRAVVAGDLVRERERVLSRLRRAGIRTLDAAPERVSVDLLNRYLDAQRRELI